MPPMTARCHIEIDDRAVEATRGQSVLEALHTHGVVVPALCHHPGLSCPATCRSCVVQVEGQGGSRMVTACNHTVAEGMIIRTEDSESRSLRSRALAEMVQRHAMECPICPASGECELQEAIGGHGPQAQAHELAGSSERVALGARLHFEAGRCIQCSRCARFEQEVSGAGQVGIKGRGPQIEITTGPAGVDHPLSGNLVDLCPAGALVDPASTVAAPAWTLRSVDTTCGSCATGCAVRADVDSAGQVTRLRPRLDSDVNDWWMCDEGRFGFDQELEGRLRLPEPATPDEETAWHVAVDRLRRRMAQPRSAVWLSPFLTLEEASVLIDAATTWGARLFLWSVEDRGEMSFPGGFRISGSRAPNTTGVGRLREAGETSVGTTKDLQTAIGEDQVGQLLMCGGGPAGVRPRLDRSGVSFLATHNLVSYEKADLVLPASHWLEKDGTFVNDRQQLRRVRPARAPMAGQTDLELFLQLAGREPTSAAEIFRELASRHEWLEGSSHAQLDANQRTHPQGVAAGGAWVDTLQRQGLLVIEDPAR
ncbi:MAG: hypothetical protein CME24_10335 [Gemmatimonadetes bacterium]|nr:hypothetical protein [Gemmatimonadota bacterium]